MARLPGELRIIGVLQRLNTSNKIARSGRLPGQMSDPAVAFFFSVGAPPAPSHPRPLSPRGREGRKTQKKLLFYSLLSPGERRGRGGEGAGGAATLKPKRRAGSVKEPDNVPTALRCSG